MPCFREVAPFPAPPESWGWFRMEEQPSPSPDAVVLAGEETATHPGVLLPFPLSSLAKPGSSQPPPSCPDQPCKVQFQLCLSLHSLSGHWAPGWPGASSLPSTQRGWCGGGRLGPPLWRCWLRGECPHPAGLGLEHVRMAAVMPALSLARRESIYQHLSQTSPDNTNKNISQYSIDPATRYPNINLQAIKASQVPASCSLAVIVTLIYPVPCPQRVCPEAQDIECIAHCGWQRVLESCVRVSRCHCQLPVWCRWLCIGDPALACPHWQVRDLYLVGTVEVDSKRKSDHRLSIGRNNQSCPIPSMPNWLLP